MVEATECIYCGEETTEPHFVSDCCGRGMCENCYQGLQGTEEQLQLDYADQSEIDRIKEQYQNANYLCYEHKEIWSKELPEYTDDQLINDREELLDFFTPDGRNTSELYRLLEIERELTKREE